VQGPKHSQQTSLRDPSMKVPQASERSRGSDARWRLTRKWSGFQPHKGPPRQCEILINGRDVLVFPRRSHKGV
jgi:hypothetical protein